MEVDSSTAKKRIVILGGGFAGVEAARYLERTAAKCDDVEVTLVSRENFTVFTPMLHEVAAGDLEPNHICNPLRKLLGRVVVDSTMEDPGHPGIWAAGDCATITDPVTRLPYPPTAQHALREGRLIGKNIWPQLEDRPTKAFVHTAPGLLASIGRRTGVAHLFGFNVSGLVGWVLWRAIYLMKLPRLEKKLRVAVEWLLNVVFERDLGQYVTLRDVESLNRLIDSAAKARSAGA